MTIPQVKLANVTLRDGTVIHGLVLQDGLATQVHPVPHDPDVPSPKWFQNAEVEKIEYVEESATP